MKKIQITIGIALLCFTLTAQTPYYAYNYKGEKVYFSLNTNHAFLSVREQQISANIQQRNIKMEELQSDRSDRKQFQNMKGIRRYYTVLSFDEEMSDEQYLALLSDIKYQNSDIIISPFFKGNHDDMIGMSNFFYVKLKDEEDTTLLVQMAMQTQAVVIEQDPFMPLWYVLSVTEASEFNAMESANLFYESGLFETAEPDLMFNNLLQCTNDAYFNDQWGLKNSGTPGIDIKACAAWQISTGRNVTVAIIDDGIKSDHPDLWANIHHQLSYDIEAGLPSSQVYGAHGTAVAGIIGAVRNNVGIAGVAPNSRLLSISGKFNSNFIHQPQKIAAGIDWTWREGGADVINCSWGNNSYEGRHITDAINRAVTEGRKRNGVSLGCVVVCASGNFDGSSVLYPASLQNVIAVGAINRSGFRDLSNYGNDLDVVAPGVDIYTTGMLGVPDDEYGTVINDGQSGVYFSGFGGTSAAAPHVAGIAALILSVNPNLTAKQVRDIIERTARKVGDYDYAETPGRPNGTWNKEMGYGLVDAYRAVLVAYGEIYGPDLITDSETYVLYVPDDCSVTWSVKPEDVFEVIDPNETSAIVKVKSSYGQSGTLTATLSNGEKYTKDIQAGLPSGVKISGPSTICAIGTYTLNDDNFQFYDWDLTEGFSISETGTDWIKIVACPTGQPGTLTAMIKGSIVDEMNIQACNWTTGSISGPNEIVSVPGGGKIVPAAPPQYEISNLPSGATVLWHPGSGLTTNEPLNSNPISFQRNVSGDACLVALLTATVTFNGNCSTTFAKGIIVGYAPDVNFISSRRNGDTVPWGQAGCHFVDVLTYKGNIPIISNLGISESEWRKHSSNEVLFYNSTASTWSGLTSCPLQVRQLPNSGVARIEARLKNSCGWSHWKTIHYLPGSNCPIIKIVYSPNPVNSELTIEFEELPDTDDPEEYTVKLLDNLGNAPRQTRFRHHRRNGRPRPVKFNTYNLPSGTYFLHVEGAGELVREQIIVTR